MLSFCGSMSSGAITIGGFFNCFVSFATTSAFRCFGTETTGLSGTFVSFSFRWHHS